MSIGIWEGGELIDADRLKAATVRHAGTWLKAMGVGQVRAGKKT